MKFIPTKVEQSPSSRKTYKVKYDKELKKKCPICDGTGEVQYSDVGCELNFYENCLVCGGTGVCK